MTPSPRRFGARRLIVAGLLVSVAAGAGIGFVGARSVATSPTEVLSQQDSKIRVDTVKAEGGGVSISCDPNYARIDLTSHPVQSRGTSLRWATPDTTHPCG
jgi:hypothetical protein